MWPFCFSILNSEQGKPLSLRPIRMSSKGCGRIRQLKSGVPTGVRAQVRGDRGWWGKETLNGAFWPPCDELQALTPLLPGGASSHGLHTSSWEKGELRRPALSQQASDGACPCLGLQKGLPEGFWASLLLKESSSRYSLSINFPKGSLL